MAQTNVGTALSRRVPSVNFQEVALTDVLDFIRDTSKVNLVVDWKSLEQAGVSRETPVTLELSHVPLRRILRTALNAAAPGVLTTYVEGNVIHVTTSLVADQQLVVRVYPVQDLLIDIPDFKGPKLAQSRNSNGGGPNGGGGGGGSMFDDENDRDKDNKRSTRAQRAEALIEVIQSTLRPEIWSVNGGPATIKYINGVLIVKAPRSLQDEMQ
ncbi:MAG TPA: hypothetical protein VGB55_15600 [Tepidisphaeraceae bacterium]